MYGVSVVGSRLYTLHLCFYKWELRWLRSHDSVRLMLGRLDRYSASCSFLVFLSAVPSSLSLVGYFDASLMDCVASRRSTGVCVFFLDGVLVSWSSKRQGLVALSSTEAEFIAETEAARELSWIVGFLQSISLSDDLRPVLFGDSKGAFALARHNVFHPCTKHIHARERIIAHMVESGLCTIE